MATTQLPQAHSSAWVAQTWISFVVSIGATALGTWLLPVDAWVRGFMGMGLLFSIGSAVSLAKTQRDLHEAQRLISRVDEARLNKLMQEHDPLAA